MKAVSIYSVRPGCIKEGAARFLAGEGAPVEGVTLLVFPGLKSETWGTRPSIG